MYKTMRLVVQNGNFLYTDEIKCKEWLQIIPVVGGAAMLAYVTCQLVIGRKEPQVNIGIKKDSKIVVDKVDIKDLGDKVAYCRCWRSKKFPLCDGSHTKYNQSSGDNVGPLCLQRRAAAS